MRGATSSLRWLAIAVAVIVVLGIILVFLGQHFYFLTRVNQQEVGVRFRGGRIYEVVGPGVYSDVALYAELKKVSSEAVSFSVEDPEVITLDRQRVGLRVSGDVFRPGIGKSDVLRDLWPSYQGIYLSDDALKNRVIDLALQAMKSCVGDRTFNSNVIGASRDELRVCIDQNLNELSQNLGLIVKNVTIPNVILSAEVQASLDAITKSRLDTELAQQDAIKAKEQAAADQAREEGAVRVELARQQEEMRQRTTLAELERERLEAQSAVIEAEKANSLLAAQKDLEINKVHAEAAMEAARAQLASELILADLYAGNPAYAYIQALLANASALTEADKIIFTQEGSTPTIVVPGPGIVPTVETTPVEAPLETETP
jgi:uncharacterized membrane protein YqiK